MNKLLALLFREIPVYKVYLAWLGLLLLLVMASSFFQPRYGKRQAQNVATRGEIRQMDLLLDEYVKANGILPAGNNVSIVTALAAMLTNEPMLLASWKINAQGAAVDAWETPLQIQTVGTTNFSIRSAGQNKKFGDKDDIIFNSLSNGFVKP
jgi:hypothetical protein